MRSGAGTVGGVAANTGWLLGTGAGGLSRPGVAASRAGAGAADL